MARSPSRLYPLDARSNILQAEGTPAYSLKQPSSSDMAQPAHCIRSVFGLQCVFLFLLTSQEAGHGEKITSGHERTTGSPETPTEHEGKTTGTHYKTTGGSAKSTRHQEKTTYVTETIKAPIKLTENPAKNTAATENIRPAAKVTGDASISTTSPCTSNTEASRYVPTGSSTPPRSIVSEAPDNKSHPQQNKDDSQGGVPEGETEGTDSFPAWAIVVVILLSVILLLVFIGLIVLASYLARTRRALIQNTENNDSENAGGSNSYPVYLMEQQTLGPSQTPGPR
ncbi:mucin-like protein 3 [Ovis canadensis]|uniref:mucin-like protein 3 n=1 Tax=Ovis canadensis TaxID=37174 RepID=UPI003750B9FE